MKLLECLKTTEKSISIVFTISYPQKNLMKIDIIVKENSLHA